MKRSPPFVLEVSGVVARRYVQPQIAAPEGYSTRRSCKRYPGYCGAEKWWTRAAVYPALPVACRVFFSAAFARIQLLEYSRAFLNVFGSSTVRRNLVAFEEQSHVLRVSVNRFDTSERHILEVRLSSPEVFRRMNSRSLLGHQKVSLRTYPQREQSKARHCYTL